MMNTTFFEALSDYEKSLSDDRLAQFKIQAAKDVLQRLAVHKLPQKQLPKLSFTKKQILKNPSLMPLDDLLSNFRQWLITQFGVWYLPNLKWLADLNHFIAGRRVLEIMAGNGLITYGLRALGNELVTATDTFQWQEQDIEIADPWTQIIPLDAEIALQNISYDVVIMSWAPDTAQTDVKILNYLRATHFTGDFILIGEPFKHTNSMAFWQTAQLTKVPELNANHHSFDTIDDRIFLVK
ncbi:SAM-dependent methyltransferase [Leuconostoc citreum]|uniref:SAM-dependent methyltransferase n=1 Tax=Leuconostoc citreum TaxID=33964 RepID=UPI00209C8A5C|nr:SAM-dependent methyltransferase [Leuconostoc citreum]MCP1276178.1 SAM-dependent methyltransferase [Leuconostoc citreum]